MADEECERMLEAHKQKHSDARKAHDMHRQFVDFTNKSANEFTSVATKASLIINGGAAIAMLGFIATVSSNGNTIKLDAIAAISALMWFAGVFWRREYARA